MFKQAIGQGKRANFAVGEYVLRGTYMSGHAPVVYGEHPHSH